MPDIYYDVDAALAEVPVNIMPLLDNTDFKTIEDAVAYNAAGMALNWHFVTSAGAYTVTAVTPTTAGNYDWTDQGTAGIYTIEIPASGGASINNDTEGYGWFTGVATGVLPWRGPVCGFRAAAINDSLCDTNTTGLLAPTTAGRTLDVTATGAAGIDWGNVENPTTALNLSGTNIDTDQVVASVAGAVGSVTGAVGSVTGAVGSVTGAVGSVTGNVGGNVAGSVGSVTGLTASDVGAIKTKTDYLPSATAGAAGGVFIAGANAATSVNITGNVTGNLSGSVGSVTGAVGSVTGAVGSVTGNVGGSVGSVTGAVGSVTGLTAADVGAIKTKTDQLTFTAANKIDANILNVNSQGIGATKPYDTAT